MGAKGAAGTSAGASICPISQRLIHVIPGVAAIELLQLMVGQSICGDSVPIEPHQLDLRRRIAIEDHRTERAVCPCLNRRSTIGASISWCRRVAALLARNAPEWTDHNASDPGITLLELFAWLGEQNIYRFDRLSDEAIRAFVRLAGVEPRPAGVACTVVGVANPGGPAIRLPARVQLADVQEALFETTTGLFVSRAMLQRILAAAEICPRLPASTRARHFPAFGSRPRPGHALYFGFDRALDAPGRPFLARLD